MVTLDRLTLLSCHLVDMLLHVSSFTFVIKQHKTRHLTLSLLMWRIYGAPSKARNLTSYINIYIYIWTRFFTGDFAP
jgi:hypothetical protein